MAKEYIEREAFREYAMEMTESTEIQFDMCYPYWQFSKAIKEMPAADVAPVRHGKWIIHTEHFAPYQQCSVCGFEIPVIATENELDIGLFRYCPNCGCRMDLES